MLSHIKNLVWIILLLVFVICATLITNVASPLDKSVVVYYSSMTAKPQMRQVMETMVLFLALKPQMGNTAKVWISMVNLGLRSKPIKR